MLAVLLFIFLPGIRAYFFIEPSFHDDGSERRLQIELAALRNDYLGTLGGCVEEEPEERADLSLQPLPKPEQEEVEEEEETQEVVSIRRGPPSEIKEVKDLEGCWEVAPSFRSSNRMLHRYCFDKAGNASSYSANLNSKGGVTSSCMNRAKVTLKGKDFVLREHSPPPCWGWVAGVYTCTLVERGVMQCQLNHSGTLDYT
jgi:hypothetical protein